MFAVSKLLAFIENPLFWVFVPLLVAVVLGRLRPGAGYAWACASLALVVFLTWTGPPTAMLRWLETRYPTVSADADLRPFVGVVLLGGALSQSELWTAYGQEALNEQAERMTVAVGLLRRHPHLTLLFTGGHGWMRPTANALTEASRARRFFDNMGVDPAQVLYEDRSRNTYENALYSATVPGVDRTRRWLLLTSANHMPRAMGVFLHAGWNVTPYPVDYRTFKDTDWMDFSFHSGPRTWETVVHELLGYATYRLLGRL